MEPDVITVHHWDAPEENDVRILTMPNVPYPIHLIAPRTLLGNHVWNMMRKHCYEQANDTCEVCGYCPENKRNRHCLEKDTEVLTSKGWKKIQDICVDDLVAGYDIKKGGEIVWEYPTSTTSHYEKDIYRFRYKSENKFSVGVSSGHRMLIVDGKTGKYTTTTAENTKVGRWTNIPASGKGADGDGLTFDERLLIALQADGTISQNDDGRYYCRIRVKKRRKQDRLKWLARNSSFDIKELNNPNPGYYGIVFHLDFNGKKFHSSFDITKMSYQKSVEFLDELVKWDGWEGTRKGFQSRCYYSSNKEDMDFVQAVCAQAGYGSHVTINRRTTRDFGKWHANNKLSTNIKPAYNLEIKKTNSYGMQTMTKELEEYNDNVFCISVPSSYFVARTKGGDVFVTGNCHELYSINYADQTVTFERVVCLCAMCHVRCIHTGRALTMYKKGSPLMTKEMLLEGAEHAYSLISKWNKDHPDEEPLRLFAAWLDYEKQDELKDRMVELRTKYDIKFYRVSEKWYKDKYWKNWKLVIGNREYPTPYENIEDWARAMEENNDKRKPEFENPFKGEVYDEVDKFLNEV